jgi:hypothetical protein
MAWRTTEEKVSLLLQEDFEDGNDLRPYITTANLVTSLVSSNDTGSLLSSALLAEIEEYLSAHFYCQQNQQLAEEKTADADGTRSWEYGKNLDGSTWGQTAKLLDITGFLRKMDTGIVRPKMTWLGKPPSEQTAYQDRD